MGKCSSKHKLIKKLNDQERQLKELIETNEKISEYINTSNILKNLSTAVREDKFKQQTADRFQKLSNQIKIINTHLDKLDVNDFRNEFIPTRPDSSSLSQASSKQFLSSFKKIKNLSPKKKRSKTTKTVKSQEEHEYKLKKYLTTQLNNEGIDLSTCESKPQSTPSILSKFSKQIQ